MIPKILVHFGNPKLVFCILVVSSVIKTNQSSEFPLHSNFYQKTLDVFLSASLQVLFERLASLDLINFIWKQNLSDELINELKSKLLVVARALDDAEVKQYSNLNVKNWLVHVKDAMYDAEDLLDEIATKALRCEFEAAESQTYGCPDVWNKLSDWVTAPVATQSMEFRVKEMVARLEPIALEKVGLGLKEGGGEKPPSRLPSTSLVDEFSVYGRDDIKKEMVNYLLSDNARGKEDIDVICIFGMGHWQDHARSDSLQQL